MKIARRALGKIDTQLDDQQKWRTLSNEEISSMWQIPPFKFEMNLRRVPYYQSWIKEVEAHAQLLLATLGRLPLSNEIEFWLMVALTL